MNNKTLTTNNGETIESHNEPSNTTASLNISEAPSECISVGGGPEAAPTSVADSENEAERLVAEMQQRCRSLLDELEDFQIYLKKQRKEHSVELRTFSSGLQAEMKTIDKLAKNNDSSEKSLHSIRSSNFLFYTSVWTAAKQCTGITALSRRFYWNPNQKMPNINGKIVTKGIKHRTYSALVDIVCQDGLEWVKVSSIPEKRIIWDLAKAGWVEDSDSDWSEDDDDDDDDEPQGLLKQAEALVKASKATRVRYQHPKIRLVLPRISTPPKEKAVSMVLQKIRNLGVTVQTKDELPTEPALSSVLETLVADRYHTFSDVINVDCTILLAFASDLSHGRVEPQDWHNKMIRRQREMEAEEQLLPSTLWPACGARKLVCTREAAVRMAEIISVIGTPTEKARRDLLLDLPSNSSLTHAQRLTQFQSLSDYTIPPSWVLPIQIIDIHLPTILQDLPPTAAKISEALSDINRSVFLYGWWSHTTTLSSNRSVAKEIEVCIEENRKGEEDRGPDVWICGTTRSLVGKEKMRRSAGRIRDEDGGEDAESRIVYKV